MSLPLYAAEWLEGGALQKAVLVVTGAASREVLERWTFDIQTDKAVVEGRWGARVALMARPGPRNGPRLRCSCV